MYAKFNFAERILFSFFVQCIELFHMGQRPQYIPKIPTEWEQLRR